jgi:isocitrate dehydrogenase kinase/phosphatase
VISTCTSSVAWCPLNIYLQDATREQIERAVIEYGNGHQGPGGGQHLPGRHAVQELRRHAQRQGRVLRLRRDRVPHRLQLPPRARRRATRRRDVGEVWYRVGPKDVFPETFGPFLLGNPTIREVFMKHHADLLDAAFWQGHKERILAGHVHDVFPYDAPSASSITRRLTRRAPRSA